MKNKILIVGYFGYATNQLDGQTIKTRNIYDLLKKREGSFGVDKLEYFDTQLFQVNKGSIFLLMKKLLLCNKLILAPGINNLTYIFPIAYLILKLRGYDIIQVAMGGWLDLYYKKHPLQRFLAKRINAILVENSFVSNQLQNKYAFRNTLVFPNFRIHDFKPSISLNSGTYKMVFMSRIKKEKGLEVIFGMADQISENYLSGDIIIDFYGPLEDDREYFLENISKYEFIRYHGELQPKDIYGTLSHYDLLLLPTRYYTEGFPGAILDAYISGIPVLVSNWKHANEFVEEGISGFICDMDDVNQFCKIVDILYHDKDKSFKLKHGALARSKEYSEEKAWQILQEYIC